MSGIYQIRNTINNKVYIGLSKNTENRIYSHKKCLIRNLHENIHLQSSFNKYGESVFLFEMIEECDEDKLSEREKYWIKKYKSHDRSYGYNRTYGGEFGKLSDEIYIEYSKRLKGCTISEQQKKKISDTLRGRKQSIEAIKSRSLSIRKCDDNTEKEMMLLFDNGLTEKEISLKYNVKETTIHSIRRRWRNAKKTN